ncbi:MAG: hypothetical protein ACOC35_04935 [Promethearchaeia archaeon]
MSVSSRLLRKYPWLPSLKSDYLALTDQDPLEFILEAFKNPEHHVKENTIRVFEAAFENVETVSLNLKNESGIYLYLTLKILLNILDNFSITNRVANLYSKQMFQELINEDDYYIYEICEDLNLDFIYYENPQKYGVNVIKNEKQVLKTRFRIFFMDYLRLAARLKDDYRRLVHKALAEGYIFIERRELLRLIQEYIRKKLSEKKISDKTQLEAFKKKVLDLEDFNEIYQLIEHEWEEKKEEFSHSLDFTYSDAENVSDFFPPCINEILRKAQDGVNLKHDERLYLVFFLHAIEYPIDKIVDIFRSSPDFDESKTEYQVKFAKDKDYTPHSCSKLKSLSLCKANEYKDEICLEGYYSRTYEKQKQIKHPLSYVKIKEFRTSKNKRKAPKNTQNEEKK